MKRLLVTTTISVSLFALCCYLIVVWHAEISTSPVATYAVLAVAGVTLIAWPIFAVKLIGAALSAVLNHKPAEKPE